MPAKPTPTPPVNVPLKATWKADGSLMVWVTIGGHSVPVASVDAGLVRHYLEDVPKDGAP